jgi:hypothetical protein
MHSFTIADTILRFPGPGGWYYVPIPETYEQELRAIVTSVWPALLPVTLTVGTPTWKGSIMPMRNGPLFIALPAKVRTAEKLTDGIPVTVHVTVDRLN